jgi:tripartite-type tricarboxylate transporter receptor subunit TctC
MRLLRAYLKILVCSVAGVLIAAITNFTSNAEESYPAKPVILTVGYSAGGGTDTATRLLVRPMEKIFKQPIVVVNKPGGAAVIQMEFVKNSIPDGYTLGVYTTGGLTGTHLNNAPYHFFDDFTHICLYSTGVLGTAVHVDSPWKTFKDLVEYGQRNPGKLRYSTTAAGTPNHITSEQIAYLSNFKWVHVPYNSDQESGAAALGKHVDAVTSTYLGWGPYVKAGKLRLLVVYGDDRLREFPDVPTAKELGYRYDFGGLALYGIFGPRDLPARVKEKVASTVGVASKDLDFIKAMESQCLTPRYIQGEEYISFLKTFDKDMVTVMKRLGLKIVREAYE